MRRAIWASARYWLPLEIGDLCAIRILPPLVGLVLLAVAYGSTPSSSTAGLPLATRASLFRFTKLSRENEPLEHVHYVGESVEIIG